MLQLKRTKSIAFGVLLLAVCGTASVTRAADPVSDFFRRLGNSIKNAGNHPQPSPRKRTPHKLKPGESPAPGEPEEAPIVVTPTPTPPLATATPAVVRRGAAVSASETTRRDMPFGVPVPNRPGFVTSPYAPGQGLVDIRGIPSGTEVKCPFTGKTFLTP